MHQTTWAKPRCGWIGLWGDQRTWPCRGYLANYTPLQRLLQDWDNLYPGLTVPGCGWARLGVAGNAIP
ncbi:hypothetical protein BDV19DRAFT_359605 [Aspergillus venezuelensis]